MRILDRYLFRESIGPFFLALGVFTFVLAVRPMLDNAQMLLAKGVPVPTVGFLLLTLLPQALGITLPMAFLAGLLMAFGRLSGDRETVALLACGVNPLRLLRPALILGALAAGVTLYVMVDLLPDSNQKFREVTAQFLRQTAESDIKPQMFYQGFPGKVIVIRNTQPAGGWDGVFMADTSKPGQITVLTAEHGRLVLDKERLIVNIVLDEVVSYVPSADDPGVFTVSASKTNTLQVDPKSVFPDSSGPNRGLAEMTIATLRKNWADKVAKAAAIQAQLDEGRFKPQEKGILEEQVRALSAHNEIMFLHQKFSFPVACLVFSLIAVPLGFHTRKEGKLAGLTVGLGVIFLYYACMEFGDAGAKSVTHWFDARWARWFPNIVLGAIGVAAVWWRVRATGQTMSFSLPSWLPRRRRTVGASAGPASPAKGGRRVVVVIRFPRFYIPRPRLLDLYVSRQFIRLLALSFLGLMGLYYIGTVVDLSERLFKGQASGWMLVQFLWYSTPRFVYFTIPIATLVAVLGTIGGLTRSSELTVMRACGVSLYRASLPLLVLGILSSGGLFLLEERVLAEANKKADELEDTIHERPHHTVNIADRNWLIGSGDRIFYYDRFDTQSAQIRNLTVFEPVTQPYRLARQVHSSVASCENRVCADGRWQSAAGWEQRFAKAGRPVRTPFATRAIALDPFKEFTLAQVDASMMTFNELRDYAKRSKASGFSTTEAEVNLHGKLAFPAVTLVMTALAIPFAVTTGRRGALYGVGLAIVLSVAYWLLMAFFLAAGKAGLLPAALAAWATNVLFTAVAGYLMLTVRT